MLFGCEIDPQRTTTTTLIRKMIQEMLIAVLAVFSHGMVDASDVCLSRDKIYTCKQRPPPFTVSRPTWCPDPSCDAEPLIIAGCAISIICIVVIFLLWLWLYLKNKTCPKPALLIFINLCLAHLGLYVFLLVSATTNGIIAISFFVDLFLLASACSYLVEAFDIWLFVSHKSIPRAWIIVGVCCWILPLLKCIIIVAANRSAYYYDVPDYFLANGRAVAIADTVLIVLICLATVVFITWSICLLQIRQEEEAVRKEIWHRIILFALMCIFFYIWVFTLFGIGLICNLAFGIVFIIFGSGNGIAILVAFTFRFVRKKEDCSDGATSNSRRSVSPENDRKNSTDEKCSAL